MGTFLDLPIIIADDFKFQVSSYVGSRWRGRAQNRNSTRTGTGWNPSPGGYSSSSGYSSAALCSRSLPVLAETAVPVLLSPFSPRSRSVPVPVLSPFWEPVLTPFLFSAPFSEPVLSPFPFSPRSRSLPVLGNWFPCSCSRPGPFPFSPAAALVQHLSVALLRPHVSSCCRPAAAALQQQQGCCCRPAAWEPVLTLFPFSEPVLGARSRSA